ncbi:class I SAM-dependent methyltransferase [Amycolatopsis suaedae]|uniref:Methyltransferase domain-containing protein n=1 Tax=Amycolatopsis suaedae TaxID=2510978 RepID=A0A4Q7J126_9PSEU|nr:methyltransferase domain-containing protein [Amycolatopsis suaedae]RZQ61080.1 methyltransferase domain-containing protein [Amycolatopsis suaedae]
MHATEIRRLTELEDHHWWYRERRVTLARELRRLAPPAPGERALDIGAAGGGNTRVLVEHGWRALATDTSEVAVELARERGLDACWADARDLPVDTASCGVVTALDVLEHIDEDRRAAAEIARVLRPGGTALVSVPCDMALWSAHDEAVGHVRRYDRAGLTAVLRGAGLVVDRVWSWNVLLRPVVALRRKRSTGSDLTELHPVVNAALRAVITAERYLPVSGLPGVSLVARAHRPAAAGNETTVAGTR